MEDFGLSPEALEAQVAGLEEVDEFNGSKDYEKFIVLSKKDLANFCRVVDPLTKQSIDEYGKSVFIRSISDEVVQLSYVNSPYIVTQEVPNKSGKRVRDFAITVATIKKLVAQAFASLILVEQDNEINIALCEALLYLETKPLAASQYEIKRRETPESLDKDGAVYVFKKLGSALALTERASEKVIVVKDGSVNFNTGVFAARAKAPFSGTQNFVLYKQVSDILAVFADLAKTTIKYGLYDEVMAIESDAFYAEVQVGGEDKVKEFMSPVADANLAFNANVQVINDNLLRIVTVVGGLEYLSDIVTLEFSKEALSLVISNQAQTKKSIYPFNIIEGTSEELGTMKVTIAVLKLFLAISGSDCKYTLCQAGLGIETADGKFIIRKS